MRSCAVFIRLNIDYSITFITSLNLDYRQRNLGGRNLYSLISFVAKRKNFNHVNFCNRICRCYRM